MAQECLEGCRGTCEKGEVLTSNALLMLLAYYLFIAIVYNAVSQWGARRERMPSIWLDKAERGIRALRSEGWDWQPTTSLSPCLEGNSPAPGMDPCERHEDGYCTLRWGSFPWQLVWKKKIGDEWDSLGTWGPLTRVWAPGVPLTRVWLEWGGCGQTEVRWAAAVLGPSWLFQLWVWYLLGIQPELKDPSWFLVLSSSPLLHLPPLLLTLVKAGVKAKASRTSQQLIWYRLPISLKQEQSLPH